MGYSAQPKCEQTFKIEENIKRQKKPLILEVEILAFVKRTKLDQ